jgi:hypothetical protein
MNKVALLKQNQFLVFLEILQHIYFKQLNQKKEFSVVPLIISHNLAEKQNNLKALFYYLCSKLNV